MKTQIKELISGNQRTVGTPHKQRMEIASKVIAENPDSIVIGVSLPDGSILRDVTLTANWSIMKKSVFYTGEVPVWVYKELIKSDFGLPKQNPKVFITIHGDCRVWIETNSKKSFWHVLPEKLITIY